MSDKIAGGVGVTRYLFTFLIYSLIKPINATIDIIAVSYTHLTLPTKA